jgi:hypothetical protein
MAKTFVARLFTTVAAFCLSTAAGLYLCAGSARADVDRVEVLDRVPLAAGKAFGNVGPYERIRGRLYLTVEAGAVENQAVADIKLAPRDAQGRVHFTADFVLLRPIDPARGNGRLLYDVNSHGNLTALPAFNSAPMSNLPATPEDAGNGFLLEQGYAVLATGWSWDVQPGGDRLRADLPVATDAGKPLTGRVEGEITVTQATNTASHVGIGALAYEPVRPDDPDALLTVRDGAFGTRTPIDRKRWTFGQKIGERTVYNPAFITLDGGFKPGAIYTLSYTARAPRVAGLGLAGIRDALLFFRHEKTDKYGSTNPLLDDGAAPPATVLAYGAAQGARLLQSMVYYGLVADGRGRMAFDGALMKGAGAGKGSFNLRFGQANRHDSPDVELDFPTDWFPFSTAPQTEAPGAEPRSVIDKSAALNAVPRLFYVNTATEYWARSASLTHTGLEGTTDLAPGPRARIYTVSGAQHHIAPVNGDSTLAHCLNPLDERPVLRSLLLHLDAWITLKQEPPASVYPQLTDGSLGKLSQYIDSFPKIPGMRTPSRVLEPPRLDFGPRFGDGIMDIVPPKVGKTFTTLVPMPDKDGLDKGGIRLPDLAVPLGTFTGWNLLNAATGTPDRVARFDGSFVPFARNENERLASSDPRASITERYATRDAYRQAFAGAALDLAEKGLILGADVDAMVERAGAFYDRLMARNIAGESCGYLFAKN